MSWKPLHEAHAIERVRVLFQFKEPLPKKLIYQSTVDILDASSELGFNSVEPAESGVTMISIQPNALPKQDASPKNGYLMRRHVDTTVAEEVGFRDLSFGYVTTTYGRWSNLKNRLNEVILPALKAVEIAAELASIKLEYWDSFVFDGAPGLADTSSLLADFDTALPQGVVSGQSTWHSHIGWFEGEESLPTLINRNLDVQDRVNEAGEQIRALGIYTLVEKRAVTAGLEIADALSVLEELHNRSLLLFGNTLSCKYRKNIGIDLDDYK